MRILVTNQSDYGKFASLTTAEYHRSYRERNHEQCLLASARNRARKYGIPFSLTVDDIHIPTHCPILGIPLTRNLGQHGGTTSSASLDRIVPELGYVSGNVQVVSLLANNMKSNANVEQLKKFAAWVQETYV